MNELDDGDECVSRLKLKHHQDLRCNVGQPFFTFSLKNIILVFLWKTGEPHNIILL